jgi:monoamine oxidase
VVVAVVGAGLAGLAAADALRGGGADVVVLEARNRVGGRVWSRELGNGAVVEMGAEFVLPGNTEVMSLAARLGLRLQPKGMRYGDREPRGGIGVEREVLLDAVAEVAAALAARPAGGPPESAAAFLARLELDPGAAEAIASRLEVSTGSTADVVEAAALAGVAAHTDEDCPGIAGGNQLLALGLADGLADAVRLSSPVERISWFGRPARVRASGAELDADAVVVAVPAAVLGRIAFDPPLPPAARGAGVVYGHAAKLFVPVRTAPAASAVLSVPERYWTWTANGADGRVQPVVCAFAGSAPALARLRVEQGPGTWLRSVAALRPELGLDSDGAVLSTWDDDPWACAGYSCVVPDDPPAPLGPLHFCGEHTAGVFHGLMEGALRSGLRAAEEILARGSPSRCSR